ncbi:toll/interleukin-1 receptor domain-containing protein [Sorangium sp. So ce233]|uniref:toll/interleukin-1 receptor domain-containing protein n=1 Tax=Sorangium sp. So ce233 TaxID=3133290 RepID=UPI003F637DCA
MTGRPTVFISYHHQDKEWKDRLVQHLKVIEKQGLLEVWDDARIGAGENWRQEIAREIARARIAVLLVSADFLTSDFVLTEEVPRLLRGRQATGLRVVPVLVRPCLWQAVPWLAEMRLRPHDGRALSAGAGHSVDANLAAISGEILREINSVASWAHARADEARLGAVGPRITAPPHPSSIASSSTVKKMLHIGLILSAGLMYFGLARACLSVIGSTGSQGSAAEEQERRLKELLRENELLDAELDGRDASAVVPPDSLSDPLAADLGDVPVDGFEALPNVPSEFVELEPGFDPVLLGYRGIVQDAITMALVRGAHVTLLGTPCDAWTDAAGVFDFAQCDPVSMSRLTQSKVLIELPNGARCSDIRIHAPPCCDSCQNQWPKLRGYVGWRRRIVVCDRRCAVDSGGGTSSSASRRGGEAWAECSAWSFCGRDRGHPRENGLL